MAPTDVSLFSIIDEATHVTSKAPNALRTISEASEMLDVPQHVLRFWETKFMQIKPLKRNGGRRFYRPQDLDVLQQIKHLLYSQGYTIKGAQKAIADYVATRASSKQDVVMPLKPSFPAAHGNDNIPLDIVDERPVDELLAELADALNEPDAEPYVAASAVRGLDRAYLTQLRNDIVDARDALAEALAA